LAPVADPVDSSVWIDDFNGKETRQTIYVRNSLKRREIVVGDLVLCGVLQGYWYDKRYSTPFP
jgi:hypothetical protein